ncbi:MAG: acetate--CoA ligase family protein, partial [Myxococcales bacterium]|nr:acetate--CoA ligase family protein [Myxococcales bacterium]
MLEALLYPQGVAVIGASRDPSKVGHAIFANLKSGGYAGRLIAVNPHAGEVLGVPARADAASCGEEIDLAVIAVPTAAVRDAVDDAIAAGAKAIIVITAGFRETGAKGAKLEAEIAARCAAEGVRLLGPNCLGVLNTDHHLNATFANHMPTAGGISVVSQSGAVCTAILDWAVERGMGLAKMVSIGNKADLSEIDLLAALGADAQTRVIVVYLESIHSGNAFIKAAEAAAARKPIVALKVGTSAAGSRAASSHTGSLAGADIAYGAAFHRSGIVRAETFEELLDFAAAFSMQPLPKGRRVAIVTNAGGPGIMAADAVEREGLEVATLGTGTATALRKKLPSAASVRNPIDVLGDADPDRYVEAVRAAQKDPSVDALLVLLTPQAMTSPEATARAVAVAHRGEMPVVAAFMGGWDVLPAREELVAEGLPDYPSPERAVAALRAMREYATWLGRPPRVVTRFAVNRRRVERIIARHLRSGERQLGEDYGKRILAAYDVRVPDGQLATNAAEAVETAEQIGYPVAMKILSPDILHKSDSGGVRLGLGDAADVRDAFDLMMLRVRRSLPKARITGAYVERMCAPGREVILGMTRDPQFGPMLMFGLG